MLVRPPLARRTVHVVIRLASWSSSRSFHPQHEITKLTMELSAPLRVCAGSCQCTSPDIIHLPRCTNATQFGSDKPYLSYGSHSRRQQSTDSTLQPKHIPKLYDIQDLPPSDRNRLTDRLLLRSPQEIDGSPGYLLLIQLDHSLSIHVPSWSTRLNLDARPQSHKLGSTTILGTVARPVT